MKPAAGKSLFVLLLPNIGRNHPCTTKPQLPHLAAAQLFAIGPGHAQLRPLQRLAYAVQQGLLIRLPGCHRDGPGSLGQTIEIHDVHARKLLLQPLQQHRLHIRSAHHNQAQPAHIHLGQKRMHEQQRQHGGHAHQPGRRMLLRHPQHGFGAEHGHQLAATARQQHGQHAAGNAAHMVERHGQLHHILRRSLHMRMLRQR